MGKYKKIFFREKNLMWIVEGKEGDDSAANPSLKS